MQNSPTFMASTNSEFSGISWWIATKTFIYPPLSTVTDEVLKLAVYRIRQIVITTAYTMLRLRIATKEYRVL